MSAREPQDVPRKKGFLFWAAIAGGLGLLCCGGLGAAAWFGARDWIGIAAAPESERMGLLSKKLESLAGDRMQAADGFLAAVDAGGGDAAWNMTSEGFRSITTRAQFDQLVHTVTSVMGPLRSRLVVNVNTRMNVGSENTTTLVLQGTFEKGAGKITMEIEGAEAPYRIRSWQTESPLFVEAMHRGADGAPK